MHRAHHERQIFFYASTTALKPARLGSHWLSIAPGLPSTTLVIQPWPAASPLLLTAAAQNHGRRTQTEPGQNSDAHNRASDGRSRSTTARWPSRRGVGDARPFPRSTRSSAQQRSAGEAAREHRRGRVDAPSAAAPRPGPPLRAATPGPPAHVDGAVFGGASRGRLARGQAERPRFRPLRIIEKTPRTRKTPTPKSQGWSSVMVRDGGCRGVHRLELEG